MSALMMTYHVVMRMTPGCSSLERVHQRTSGLVPFIAPPNPPHGQADRARRHISRGDSPQSPLARPTEV
jgi:hypothetical protein